jgi:hypothetical protein
MARNYKLNLNESELLILMHALIISGIDFRVNNPLDHAVEQLGGYARGFGPEHVSTGLVEKILAAAS